MSEFSDRPFALGTVTGLRAFRISPRRQIFATCRRWPWQPGENRAECLPETLVGLHREHTIAAVDCSCGFYAYFGDGNDYGSSPFAALTVTGIIEAYGLVTIGTRGFRAEKASPSVPAR